MIRKAAGIEGRQQHGSGELAERLLHNGIEELKGRLCAKMKTRNDDYKIRNGTGSRSSGRAETGGEGAAGL